MSTRYTDYGQDRPGWFFGLTGPQLTLLAVTGLPELIALGSSNWALVLGWAPLWSVLIVLVAVPVRGWSCAQWIGVLTGHLAGAVAGWTPWQSRAAAGTATDPDQPDLPGVLAGVQIHDGPPFGTGLTRVAIVQDHAGRTWAAVARITHPGIGMAENDERDRMAAGLAAMLETAARTDLIGLLAAQVRTVPDDGAERTDWVRRHRHPDSPDLARSVNELLDTHLTPAAVRRETFVTVVVPEARIARAARECGGGIDGRARVLHGVLAEIEARLRGGLGCAEVAWLDSPSLAQVIRTGFAPGDRAALTAADLAAATDPAVATGVAVAAAGPGTAHTEVRHYRHDAWASVTDTILLPEQGAILGALAPVFTPSAAGERRSVTIFYRPLAPSRADRVTGREEMSALVGAELRRRTGRLERARQRRATGRAHTTDEKLAHGRALVRVAAAATVTVPATWPITEYGRRLDAAIRLSGFIPQRLDGAQDAAFAAAAIPLGIGLPNRRGDR